jgi:hypothetical protein
MVSLLSTIPSLLLPQSDLLSIECRVRLLRYRSACALWHGPAPITDIVMIGISSKGNNRRGDFTTRMWPRESIPGLEWSYPLLVLSPTSIYPTSRLSEGLL